MDDYRLRAMGLGGEDEEPFPYPQGPSLWEDLKARAKAAGLALTAPPAPINDPDQYVDPEQAPRENLRVTAMKNAFNALMAAQPDNSIPMGSGRSFDPTAVIGSVKPDKLGFYSKLEQLMQEKMGPKAMPEQVMAIAQGAKKEELARSGLEGFVSGKDKLTREEVLSHLEGQYPQIDEVVRGEIPKEDPAGIARRKAIFDEYRPKLDEIHRSINEEASTGDARIVAINRLNALSDERDLLADAAYTLAADNVKPAKYGKYTLPGGENYREVLLTLPASQDGRAFEKWISDTGRNLKDYRPEELLDLRAQYVQETTRNSKNNFKSDHFDEPNILAHARVNDRVGPDGKTLFIEEAQSDWHQAGRGKGYRGEEYQALKKRFEELDRMRSEGINKDRTLWQDLMNRAREIHPDSGSWRSNLPNILTRQGPGSPAPEVARAVEAIGQNNYNLLFRDPEVQKRLAAWKSFNEGHNKTLLDFHDVQVKMSDQMNAVPDAPFKKNWHELMLKRLLRKAAEEDYDNLAWTTGAQQADRYKLSKHVDNIQYNRKSKTLLANDKRGVTAIDESNVSEEKLADYIGKEAAEKLLRPESAIGKMHDGTPFLYELSGANLDVGGEGMKEFYDKMIPDFLNKIGKQHGQRVGLSEILTSDEVRGVSAVEDGSLWKVIYEDTGKEVTGNRFKTEESANNWVSKAPADLFATKMKSNSLKLTPEMKKAILEKGFPLFAIPPALLMRQQALED